ncbi:MAG TPA: Hsp20 family protein [Verrucomicrobiales bacterium]|nr:Hsp20 family protein [Verrucomicrobiales bacterium]
MNTNRKKLAIGLSLVAGIAIVTGAMAGEKDQPAGFLDKMKQWQAEMSETFRKALGNSKEASSPASASVDLREQSDSYVIRLSLPGRAIEKVDVDLDGNQLRIDAPSGENAARYRQSITLPGAADGIPEIERKPKEGVIVVKVPKSSAKGDARERRTPFLPLLDHERDVLERIEQMQREMDRIFDRGFHEFRLMPGHRDFFDKSAFGSSVEVKEEGDNYVVRAYLPGRDSNDVNVTAEGETLRIEAKSEKSDRSAPGNVSSKSHYSQFLTLPGPVDSMKMRVDRKEGMLVITLPKSTAK